MNGETYSSRVIEDDTGKMSMPELIYRHHNFNGEKQTTQLKLGKKLEHFTEDDVCVGKHTHTQR